MKALVLPLALLVTLAACSSGDAARESPPAATAPAATAATPAAAAAAAQAKPAQSGGVRLVSLGSFRSPVHVTAPPGDTQRVFVVEQRGTIRIIRGGKRLSRPFLDISSLIPDGVEGTEQGLLSLAFAPDYAKTRRFYVNYTDSQGLQSVAEYQRSKSSRDRALAGTRRPILRYDGVESNHNGGLLVFGPDKLLYIGTGDGGGANDEHGERGNAQDLGSLLGKILRIDPRRSGARPYSVPSSNPFVSRPGARAEIYSYGLRNPWRFSFDRTTGDLTIGDVGQNEIEEIDFAAKGAASGANYGWRPLEGNRRNFDEPAPGAVAPVLELSHGDNNCSVTGGYVVRDKALPALAGRYVYGDFCKGELRSVKLATGSATGDRSLGLQNVEQLSSFGEDARGRVYVVSLGGPVYRLAAG